ncbi:MAG: D-amino acid dehydrogenase [Steroidobacteraceae bacterium]|nr:D-amino acid dehydrogenase [Steroidobacteraceae bacterium]
MQIIVVGAGLVGVTSAYRLQRAGHSVTVVEREAAVACGASQANGGMLTPSMADPWNAPGVWRELLHSLGHAEAPLLLRPRAIPSLLGWGLRFLGASTTRRYGENTARNLRLAAYSVSGMDALRREEALEYGAATRGTLKIYRDAAAFDSGLRKSRTFGHPLVEVRALTAAQTVALEPGLTDIEGSLAGALHFPGDEAGDARLFTEVLGAAAERRGVRFLFGTAATRIIADKQVRALATTAGDMPADAIVVAAGSQSAALLRGVGLRLPVAPVKGYSLTCEPSGTDAPPPLAVPVVDDALHAAVTPLGRRIRIAGTAEFTGFDLQLSPPRIENLRRLLRAILPRHADRLLAGNVVSWAGLRPMSADGVPCIGPCGPAGLYVNAGHGHLGWTMADGSARLLADLVDHRPAALEPRDYSPRRFRWAS